LKLSRDGLVLVNYTDGTGHLAVFTINGRLLSERKLDDQMLALALNKDGNFFVSGGFSRYLRIWRTHDLSLLHTYAPCDGSIRALTVSTDQRCLVAGLASGKILAIAVDFPGRLSWLMWWNHHQTARGKRKSKIFGAYRLVFCLPPKSGTSRSRISTVTNHEDYWSFNRPLS